MAMTMALKHSSYLILSLFLLLLIPYVVARSGPVHDPSQPGPLSARLQGMNNVLCWDSLMELKSCTGEVVVFFLNGATYLSPSCCRSIRVIERNCWAAEAMLIALGFTAGEGDILRKYCSANDDKSPVNTTTPPDSSRGLRN